jgi:mannose-6-phosphate isomerase-like protein (cupin superfamily)
MDHTASATVYEIDDQPVRDRLGVAIQFFMNTDRGDTQLFDQGVVTVEPGEPVTRHVHRHSGETFYGMAGEGEIVVAGEPRPCHADEHLVFVPPGVPHYPRNPADADGAFRAMFVHVPALLDGDTYPVDEDGNPVEDGQPVEDSQPVETGGSAEDET